MVFDRRIYSILYHFVNRERDSKRSHEYYLDHRDKIRSHRHQYYLSKRQYYQEYAKRYYRTHPEAKIKGRAYAKSPKGIAWRRAYNNLPEVKVKLHARHRSYYLKNREREIAKTQEWQRAHPDYMKTYQKVYYEVNRQKLISNHRLYYAANRVVLRAKMKLYYEANKDRYHQKNGKRIELPPLDPQTEYELNNPVINNDLFSLSQMRATRLLNEELQGFQSAKKKFNSTHHHLG